jgi:hypothetical protein
MLGVVSLLTPMAQLVLGIFGLKLSKTAGGMMIASPVMSIAAYAAMMMQPLVSLSSAPEIAYYVLIAMSSLAQVLFYAGVFMMILQAKAVKKRAQEQQMLLDEITSRQ